MPREYSQRVASGTDSTTESIRRVLLSVEDALEIDVQGRTDAAVLVPLYTSGGELHAVFTKRRDDLRRHPGEISFPGGRYDEGERDLLATALREAEEEIGLPADAVEVLGALQPTPTIATGYAVYPFVGMIEAGRSWTPSAGEVADVLELSLPDLLAGYARRRLVRRGLPIRTDTYLVDDHLIWGATARILADLFDRIGGLCPEWSHARPGQSSELERRVVALGADLSNLGEPVRVVLRRRALQGIGERPSLSLVGPVVGRQPVRLSKPAHGVPGAARCDGGAGQARSTPPRGTPRRPGPRPGEHLVSTKGVPRHATRARPSPEAPQRSPRGRSASSRPR